jgi:hypothetical protein
MAYQMNRADVYTLNERRQIFGMDDRGKAGCGRWPLIGIVISAAVGDDTMVSGKGFNLAIPRSIISKRTVNQQDSVSLSALDVVQRNAIDLNLC